MEEGEGGGVMLGERRRPQKFLAAVVRYKYKISPPLLTCKSRANISPPLSTVVREPRSGGTPDVMDVRAALRALRLSPLSPRPRFG